MDGRAGNGCGMQTDTSMNGDKSIGRRLSRVRSSVKKRGSRGKGGKKRKQLLQQEQKKNKESQARVPCPEVPNVVSESIVESAPQSSGSMVEGPFKKRVRERKNRKWKPFSEMTWQERLEKEREEDRKAELAASLELQSSSRRKKRKKGRDVDVPRAPRNTTQNLLHTDSDLYHDEAEGMPPAQVPSMYGLLSREALRLARTEESDESSSDEDEADRIAKKLYPGGLSIMYAASPASPGPHYSESDDEHMATEDGTENHTHLNGVNGGGDQNDGEQGSRDQDVDRVVLLEEENKNLRNRVAMLEETLRQKESAGNQQ